MVDLSNIFLPPHYELEIRAGAFLKMITADIRVPSDVIQGKIFPSNQFYPFFFFFFAILGFRWGFGNGINLTKGSSFLLSDLQSP